MKITLSKAARRIRAAGEKDLTPDGNVKLGKLLDKILKVEPVSDTKVDKTAKVEGNE